MAYRPAGRISQDLSHRSAKGRGSRASRKIRFGLEMKFSRRKEFQTMMVDRGVHLSFQQVAVLDNESGELHVSAESEDCVSSYDVN